jgi:four helix bundle protein
MTVAQRQDLCARALRFSIDIGTLYRRTETLGAATRHAMLQLYRSGTAVGAMLEEGQVANSRRDMAAKYAIALREAREAQYWSRLLADDPALTTEALTLAREAGEFVAMLTVSVKKLRQSPL